MNIFTKSVIQAGVWALFRTVLLIGISFVIVVPLLNRMSSALMSIEDVYDQSVRWIPRNPTLGNFKLMWEHMNYVQAFGRSFFLAFMTSALHLVSSTMVGYGLARFKFRGNGLIFACAILTLLVPPQLIMIPMYLNFRFFDLLGALKQPINLMGTYWPFILMGITANGFRCGLYIFINRQFFRGLPKELEEAAYIDGAGIFKTFWTIMIPSAIPSLVTTFLFSFVWQWNDYLYVTTFMAGHSFLPLELEAAQPRIHRAISAADQFAASSGFLDNHFYSLINNAGMILIIAPLLIMYLFLQRYFVESVERTGIVG